MERSAKQGRPDRGGAARRKLLAAAIDVFGRLGFDGACTRALADAAGVNLQAIPYYFGGKEGLYLAAAEHIAALIGTHTFDLRERVRSRLDEAVKHATPLKVYEARSLLTEIVQTLATLFVSRESEAWARFIIREQMEPTAAFSRLYEGAMKPGMEVTRRLLAEILGERADSELVRLRTLSLIGSILVFRMAHATAMAELGWKSVGRRELDVVRNHCAELVAAISRPEASA